MNRFLEFVDSKKYLLFGLLGALLISMTLKTQVVILTYGDDYSMRMEYTLYGYCVRASAALKATEPAVQNEIYFGNSFETSVMKAVRQMENLNGEKDTVGIMVTGYPRNTEKLELQLKDVIEQSGREVEILLAKNSD